MADFPLGQNPPSYTVGNSIVMDPKLERRGEIQGTQGHNKT